MSGHVAGETRIKSVNPTSTIGALTMCCADRIVARRRAAARRTHCKQPGRRKTPRLLRDCG